MPRIGGCAGRWSPGHVSLSVGAVPWDEGVEYVDEERACPVWCRRAYVEHMETRSRQGCMTRIALISTGGTIEKTYDELSGVLENDDVLAALAACKREHGWAIGLSLSWRGDLRAAAEQPGRGGAGREAPGKSGAPCGHHGWPGTVRRNRQTQDCCAGFV